MKRLAALAAVLAPLAALAVSTGCGFAPLHGEAEPGCSATRVVAEASVAAGPEALAAAVAGAEVAVREEGGRCGTLEVSIVRSSYGASSVAAIGGFPRAQATEVIVSVAARWQGAGSVPEALAPVTVVTPLPATSDARTATLGEATALAQTAHEAGRRAALRALGHPVAGDATGNQ